MHMFGLLKQSNTQWQHLDVRSTTHIINQTCLFPKPIHPPRVGRRSPDEQNSTSQCLLTRDLPNLAKQRLALSPDKEQLRDERTSVTMPWANLDNKGAQATQGARATREPHGNSQCIRDGRLFRTWQTKKSNCWHCR